MSKQKLFFPLYVLTNTNCAHDLQTPPTLIETNDALIIKTKQNEQIPFYIKNNIMFRDTEEEKRQQKEKDIQFCNKIISFTYHVGGLHGLTGVRKPFILDEYTKNNKYINKNYGQYDDDGLKTLFEEITYDKLFLLNELKIKLCKNSKALEHEIVSNTFTIYQLQQQINKLKYEKLKKNQ